MLHHIQPPILVPYRPGSRPTGWAVQVPASAGDIDVDEITAKNVLQAKDVLTEHIGREAKFADGRDEVVRGERAEKVVSNAVDTDAELVFQFPKRRTVLGTAVDAVDGAEERVDPVVEHYQSFYRSMLAGNWEK